MTVYLFYFSFFFYRSELDNFCVCFRRIIHNHHLTRYFQKSALRAYEVDIVHNPIIATGISFVMKLDQN